MRQLEDLSRQMEALLQEKAELEVKNRILSKDLTTWQDHLEQLWGKKVTHSTDFHLYLVGCFGTAAQSVLWQADFLRDVQIAALSCIQSGPKLGLHRSPGSMLCFETRATAAWGHADG